MVLGENVLLGEHLDVDLVEFVDRCSQLLGGFFLLNEDRVLEIEVDACLGDAAVELLFQLLGVANRLDGLDAVQL